MFSRYLAMLSLTILCFSDIHKIMLESRLVRSLDLVGLGLIAVLNGATVADLGAVLDYHLR